MTIRLAFEEAAERAEEARISPRSSFYCRVECVAPNHARHRGRKMESLLSHLQIGRFDLVPMLFRPVVIAARFVVPVPANGSRIVSPANEKSLIKRSARAIRDKAQDDRDESIRL